MSLASRPGVAGLRMVLLALVVGGLAGGCSVRKLAIRQVAKTFAESGQVFSADDDPELVRDAMPFALKTMEALLEETPDHRGLLTAACRGFTSYAYAFVELEAERLSFDEYSRSAALRRRALRLYLRARNYCFRGLETIEPGLVERLQQRPGTAVLASVGADEVELLYWSGASWGAAIALGLDRPELVIDLPAVRGLLDRALELEPHFDAGAIHEAMISAVAVPEMMGGSYESARQHFERAVELSGGARAGPFVTLAIKVAVPQQDPREFRRLLGRALAVDPDGVERDRLANRLNQRRARWLLERIEDLFLVIDDDIDSAEDEE